MILKQINNEKIIVATNEILKATDVSLSSLSHLDSLKYSSTEGKFVNSSSYTPDVPMKTFSTATDAELVQMVQAADAGLIDLYDDCGWRVGQERTINLSAIAASGTYGGISWTVGESQPAQTVTLVLMHRGLYQLVDPILDKQGRARYTCNFVVGLKNALSTKGYISSSTSYYWKDTSRQIWCNSGFRSALPNNIRSLFKKFNCLSAQSSNQPTRIIYTQDYFSLPAEKEVFGSRTYSVEAEAANLTALDWYKTAANRIKTLGDNGEAVTWWSRSTYQQTSGTTYYFFIAPYTNGTNNYVNMTNSSSIAISPFGCI